MKPTPRQYAQALLEMMHGKSASQQQAQARDFLSFLRRKREMGKLPAILRTFEALSEIASGTQSVEVSVAQQELANDTKALADLAHKALSQPTDDIKVHVDSSLIGGMRIRTRDVLWDGSIRTKLRRLKRSLSS